MFAILASQFNPDTDDFGTCLKCDDTLQVLGYKDMVKAISRLNNKDIYAPIRKEIPKAHLRNLLQQRREMVPSLSESVREIELAYIATLGAKSKKIVTPQPHARKPKKKSKKSKKKVVLPQLRTYDILKDGTDVAAFYYDCEMDPAWALKPPDVLENPCGPGQLYRGLVMSHRITEKQDLMYVCKFETPLQHSHEFTETYTAKMVCSFSCAKEDRGWRVARADVVSGIAVGMCITRWFSLKELPGLAEDGTLVGDYVDGIVIDTGKKAKNTTYKCSFDAPASFEQWYSETETRHFVDKHNERYGHSTVRVTPTSHDKGLITLSKGASQLQALSEACAVSSRLSLRPTKSAFFVPETQGGGDDEGHMETASPEKSSASSTSSTKDERPPASPASSRKEKTPPASPQTEKEKEKEQNQTASPASSLKEREQEKTPPEVKQQEESKADERSKPEEGRNAADGSNAEEESKVDEARKAAEGSKASEGSMPEEGRNAADGNNAEEGSKADEARKAAEGSKGSEGSIPEERSVAEEGSKGADGIIAEGSIPLERSVAVDGTKGDEGSKADEESKGEDVSRAAETSKAFDTPASKSIATERPAKKRKSFKLKKKATTTAVNEGFGAAEGSKGEEGSKAEEMSKAAEGCNSSEESKAEVVSNAAEGDNPDEDSKAEEGNIVVKGNVRPKSKRKRSKLRKNKRLDAAARQKSQRSRKKPKMQSRVQIQDESNADTTALGNEEDESSTQTDTDGYNDESEAIAPDGDIMSMGNKLWDQLVSVTKGFKTPNEQQRPLRGFAKSVESLHRLRKEIKVDEGRKAAEGSKASEGSKPQEGRNAADASKPEESVELKKRSKRGVGTRLSVNDRGDLVQESSSARGHASDIDQSNEGQRYDEWEREVSGSDVEHTGDDNMEPCDAESSDYYMWNGQWYKWEERTWDEEWQKEPSHKRRNPAAVNTRVRNWMLAMRRNMKPEVKAAALQPFTITRDRMHEVKSM